MRDVALIFVAFIVGAIWGLVYLTVLRAETETEAVTLPPVEVTEPACEWGGPYPYTEGTEMWIVICKEGERDA